MISFNSKMKKHYITGFQKQQLKEEPYDRPAFIKRYRDFKPTSDAWVLFGSNAKKPLRPRFQF